MSAAPASARPITPTSRSTPNRSRLAGDKDAGRGLSDRETGLSAVASYIGDPSATGRHKKPDIVSRSEYGGRPWVSMKEPFPASTRLTRAHGTRQIHPMPWEVKSCNLILHLLPGRWAQLPLEDAMGFVTKSNGKRRGALRTGWKASGHFSLRGWMAKSTHRHAPELRPNRRPPIRDQGRMAIILTGPPVPPLILMGNDTRIAPLGGSWSRFAMFSRPYRSAPFTI